MSKRKKKIKWMKKRHRIVTKLAFTVLGPYTKWKYGVDVKKFKEQGDRGYLILYNHQTAFDQFFVGMSFDGPVYYLATEDIFSIGWVSRLLQYLVAPIPIKKQATDVAAVMNCFRVAKEGGTIAIAPEGNRTYSGRTEYMNPAIISMIKKMKMPVALYRIEGGYGVQPRWSDVVRKGKMRAGVSQVIEPEECASMTDEELYERIRQGLAVDEGNSDGIFESDKRAEYLERAIYVCPSCGLSEFESHGNQVECKKCHRKVEYGRDKTLTGVDFEFPFRYMTEWYDYQNDYVCGLDLMQHTEKPLFTDTANLSEVIVYKRKEPLRQAASIHLYGDRIVVDEGREDALVLPFDEISTATVLGKNKLNIYHGDKIYQFKSDERFNALKYVNFYFRYKQIDKGEEGDKFLGI